MRLDSNKSSQHFLVYETELQDRDYPQSHLVHSHPLSASLSVIFISGPPWAYLRAPSFGGQTAGGIPNAICGIERSQADHNCQAGHLGHGGTWRLRWVTLRFYL